MAEIRNEDDFLDFMFKIGQTKKFGVIRPPVVLGDGTTISIQASEVHYSTPRENNRRVYLSWELGFPSREIPEILKYMEGLNHDPTDSVYPFVPTRVILELIRSTGGTIM